MGKREADLDGIKYYYDPDICVRGGFGSTVYLVPCSKCGTIMERISYGRNSEYLCDECKYGRKQKNKAIESELYKELTTPGERRLLKAINNIKSQVKNFNEYSKSVSVAKKAADKFGSIPETMVGIELLRLGYKIIPQKKIGKLRVDFYLPEENTVIEVDGQPYHNRKRDNERDAQILLALGIRTKIIHIPAELIAKDIRKLKECIEKMP